MSLLYADTSALVRAYFVDEPEHRSLKTLLLEGEDPVITSELTRLELASAVAAAHRHGRLRRPQVVLDRFDADCGDGGPVALIRFDPARVLPVARELVLSRRVRTLDALHLAVALTDGVELSAGQQVLLVTRDATQAEAALALGLASR